MLDRGSESRSSFPPARPVVHYKWTGSTKKWTLGTQRAPDLHQKHEIGIWAQIELLLRSLYAYYKNIQENINFCEI